MAERIRPPAQQQDAPSAFSWVITSWSQENKFTCSKELRSAAQVIYFWLLISLTEGYVMFASQAALFPLQREPFSCRDTHAFQQNLSSASYSLYSFCCFFLYFKMRFM